MLKLPRRTFLHLAAGAAALQGVSRIACAQAYPSRPVRIIVGFPAGGADDIFSRLLGQWLSERLGQQFIIENRPGAGSMIAAAAAARSPADGYTLLTLSAPTAISSQLYENLTFDLIQDFVPIAGLVRVDFLLLINPSVPAKTVPELIAYVKDNPGKINVGHPGNGTLGHVTSELLQQMTGVKVTNIAYRGSSPLMTDLLGATIDVAIDFMPAYVPLILDGQLKPLAVTSAGRSSLLPNVPTANEAGLSGFEASAWYAIVIPKNAPDEVLRGINGVVNAWLTSEKGKAVLEQNGMQGVGGSASDLSAFIASELNRWGPLIKAAKIEF